MNVNELKKRANWLIKARFYVICIFTVVGITQSIILSPEGYLELLRPVSFLILIILTCNFLYITVLKKRRWNFEGLNIFVHVQLIFDIIIITILIHFSGGIESSYFIVYLFIIFGASLLLYPISTYFVATLGTVCYALLLLLEYRGIVSQLTIFDFRVWVWRPGLIVSTFVFRTGSFYIAAIFSNYLSRILKRKSEEQEKSYQLQKLFISILTHDLKNFLQLILGYTQIAAKTKNMEHLKRAEEAVRKMNSIIDNAKLYSKLREKEYEEKFERKNLYEIVEKTVKIFEVKREIEIHCEDKNCIVQASPTLENVFYNLIDNAVKYSEKKIEVSINDDLKNWRVCVKDYGNGIPDELKDVVFEKFKKMGKGAGTGLGLAIVKQSVALHKGKVWIEDNPEGGSIFCVSLPKAAE